MFIFYAWLISFRPLFFYANSKTACRYFSSIILELINISSSPDAVWVFDTLWWSHYNPSTLKPLFSTSVRKGKKSLKMCCHNMFYATSHSRTEHLPSVAVYAKRYRNRTGLSYHYTHSHLAEEDRAGERSSVASRSASVQQTDRHKCKSKCFASNISYPL